MTEKEYMELLNAMNKAEESVVPFAVPTDDEIVVVGDPNATETVLSDYRIVFRVPRKDESGKIVYRRDEVEYKDVVITGRNDPKILQAMSDLYPFFKKVNDNGGVEKYTEAEMLGIVAQFSDEMIDRMYNVVASVLGIDPVLKDYMEYGSVMDAMGQIIRTYPSMINESGAFFQSSSAGRTNRRPL